ncbi:MAG: DUF3253 domain-containing protein [Hyphomicrobiales bacterium]|nr:DUF3253 domain-containing protein [Hyphomicrobiales bacterium]
MDDHAIEKAILTLCVERRAVAGWLQKDGRIAVTQKQVAVEADMAKGAIRLGLPKV